MNRTNELLELFKSGELSPAQSTELERMVESGLVDLEDLSIYTQVLESLHGPKDVELSTDLDHKFYQMLRAKKKEVKSSIFSGKLFEGWRLALTLGFASVTFLLGTQFNTNRSDPNSTKKQDMLTQVMSTKDINDRIHLVSSAQVTESVDNQVTTALLFSLMNDNSTNVRLASIEALLNYAHLEPVRSGLIKAISHQSSPVVLTYLAEAIQVSGQPLEQEDFKKLLDTELPPPLLKSMVEVLPTL